MADREFLEKTRRELSAEELAGLRAYSASADRGSIVFLPVITKMGANIRWSARVHLKGAAGPVPLSRASLKAIGAPENWVERSRVFLQELEREYPSLPATFPDRQALPEG